jgi:hypothetical protein
MQTPESLYASIIQDCASRSNPPRPVQRSKNCSFTTSQKKQGKKKQKRSPDDPVISTSGGSNARMTSQDSPLSIAASITGILTFVAAVVAGFYAHAISLRNAIDTQAEIYTALEKIEFLETETDMLNNSYLASQIRQPERKYGSGDFKYFQGLYRDSLQRMRMMDRELRDSAARVTGGSRHDRMSRVKAAANWMAARDHIHRDIEERKAESTRIFQIQLAMLSA